MNSTWHALDLGDAIMAHEPMEQICKAFEEFVSQNSISPDFAIFTRNDSEGRLHCQVTAYFSPAAIQIAKLFNAVPCAKPSRDNLDLLAGRENCWKVLFPEKV
ncbi:MAG TPA: hypothetical protein PLX90_11010 [Anaerolineales bacterium]|nr:hypothetical protein [Anaerolineales bacterium]